MTHAHRILVVEDEPNVGFGLQFNLEEEGYDVTLVETLHAARARIGDGWDLVLLDVMLPDGDGMQWCRELRARGDLTPVLMLTARATAEDTVDGLEAGADDYLAKPFTLEVLLGRVRARLRRSTWQAAPRPAQLAEIGALSVDFDACTAQRGGAPVELTALEMKLLRYLLDHTGRAVPREELLSQVWGVSASVTTRTVDNFIMRLRRLVERDASEPEVIVTVRGVGYRLEG